MSSQLPDTSARRAPENLAILLREPFVAMSDGLMRRLAATGHPEVRYAHGAVFQYLDDAGTRVSDLAARARITKQSMAELVAHLERHGYVERVPDPGDRRAKLRPRRPARGREVFAIARAAMDDVDARLDAALGPARVRELRVLLEDVRTALARGVLGPIDDGRRAAPRLASSSCPPPSSPAPPAASGARSPLRSPTAAGASSSTPATALGALRAARPRGSCASAQPSVVALAGDVADPWHRHALIDAAGDAIDLARQQRLRPRPLARSPRSPSSPSTGSSRCSG